MRPSTEVHPDPSAVLHDGTALDEIELYAEVLAAAAHSDRPLRPDELDRVLGVGADRPEPSAARPRRGPAPLGRLFRESA